MRTRADAAHMRELFDLTDDVTDGDSGRTLDAAATDAADRLDAPGTAGPPRGSRRGGCR